MGIDDKGFDPTQLLSLFDGFEKYIEQQMDARNYDLVLNLPFLMSIERQRQLLGGDGDNSSDLLEKVRAFNRFKLDVQIDYEGYWEGCRSVKNPFDAKLPKAAFQLIVIKDPFSEGDKNKIKELLEGQFYPLLSFKEIAALMYK